MPIGAESRPSSLHSIAADVERILDELELPDRSVAGPPQQPANLADAIEHTLLAPGATSDQLATLCDEAVSLAVLGVCVSPVRLSEARDLLADSPCIVAAVVGFPSGAHLTETKAHEAAALVRDGADELDMVISVGALKMRNYTAVHADITAVVAAAGRVPVKVILETGMLSDSEKIAGCLIAARAGARFVKTSTGFGLVQRGRRRRVPGATSADVRLMKRIVGTRLGIKAAGGIKSLAQAERLLSAGATRIGTSSAPQLLRSHSKGTGS